MSQADSPTPEELARRIDELEDRQRDRDRQRAGQLAQWAQANLPAIKRRGFVALVAAAFGLSIPQVVAAQERTEDRGDCRWFTDVDAEGYELYDLGATRYADAGADPDENGGIQRNGTDLKVFSGGAVRNMSNIGSGGGGSTSPGGSDTQLQYNNGGSFGGTSGFTWDDSALEISTMPGINDTLALVDQAADPSAAGEMQLNSTDIKAHSGGAVRNLSNIAPNVPDWQEDANSPLDGSGGQSHQISLSGSFDRVMAFGQNITNDHTSAQEIQCQANGDGGNNYSYVTADGTETTGAAGWQVYNSLNVDKRITIPFDYERSAQNGISILGPSGAGGPGGSLVIGKNTSITPPVSSLTFRGVSGNITAKARVYGWDGGI